MRNVKLLLLVALVSVFTVAGFVVAANGPLDGPTPPPGQKAEKPPAPAEVSCLTVEGLGPDFYVPLNRPIPVNSKGEIRAAFLRVGQEMQLFGSDADKVKGAKLVLAALDSGVTVEYGRMCYVWLARCAPECTGAGCAHIRVPCPK